ncbi:MAG: glycosyltransferase [Nitrosopumilus sp.]|nr:glycosyltransferase [Nitrosopumilus sp.]
MKILFAGNIANVGYLNCKYLQKIGISADLLMESNPPSVYDPLKTDSSLNGKYPDWIKFYQQGKSGWKRRILKIMQDKKYDLIQSQYDFTIFAYISRKKYVPQIVGSDLSEIAFSNSLRGILMKRALRKPKTIFFTTPPDKVLLQKLNIHTGIFVPIMWDTDYFKPDDSNLNNNSTLTIFHPTNLNFKFKGNNILIEAFAEFIKNSPDSILTIIDRGVDSENTHRLVERLRLKNNVKFIKGPLNYEELRWQYIHADIIADQFILSGLGGIGCESLACGKPLLVNCPPDIYENLHDEDPPVLHCKNHKDILKNLQVLKDKEFRKNIGKRGREWVVKHHSPKSIIFKSISIYKKIIDGGNVNKIS